jgi:hypothetical protein
MAFIGMFNLQDLVGHHWDFCMRDGDHPTNARVCFEKDKNLVDKIQTSKVTFAKLLKVAWGAQD